MLLKKKETQMEIYLFSLDEVRTLRDCERRDQRCWVMIRFYTHSFSLLLAAPDILVQENLHSSTGAD